MKRKSVIKTLAFLLCVSLTLLSFSACSVSGGNDNNPAPSSSSNGSTVVSDMFSDGDYKDVSGETPNAEIVLAGDSGTISDTTRGASGQTVTVTSKGIYRVTGSAENVTVTVMDTNESGNVYLLFDNVTMTSSGAPCLLVENADKVILQVVGENSLTSTGSEAIKAKDDLTILGAGSLTVTSDTHAIDFNDDLKITGANLTVNAGKIGVTGGDSLKIGGGNTVINAAHDGVQLENDEGTSLFYIEDGALTVNAGYDGISVGTALADFTGGINLAGGRVTVTAGGGSDNAKSETSQKGLKCDGGILVGSVELSVSSADDAINGETVTVSAGQTTLSTSDDAVHAAGAITVTGGALTVTKAYEGLEGGEVTVSGGTVKVTSSDDGVNAAGGSDSTSAETDAYVCSGNVTISGGSVYIDASGDGVDANGSVVVTGGTLIVEGPVSGANGALDSGDADGCVCEITGGTVLAVGTKEMAKNFSAGSVPSALVYVDGKAGDTITVGDFSYTAAKDFTSVVYASDTLEEGGTYTLTVGETQVTLDFTNGLYFVK